MADNPSKVLVVEDSLAINKILTDNIVSQLHLDVIPVFDMKAAIQTISENPGEFFVAILDLNLPDAPHGEVVEAMLTLGIKPIILTATLSDDLHDEMLAKPIIDYVVKRNLSEMQYVIDLVGRLYENFQRKVLVVDDSRTSRKLVRSLLERHNFLVVEASCGTEALSALNSDMQFNLMIVDYNMPDMQGFELITKVRNDYSREDMAIIGISATGTGSVSIQMLKAGANDFIARPFMHEEFYCRVNQNIDAFSNLRKLKEQAFFDALTGLYNRQYLFESGSRLHTNACREQLTMCVAIIDIDYFKGVNEEHGHKVGDQALVHISGLIAKHFRHGDVAARMDGGTIGMLCLNVEEGTAFTLFERFRNRVLATPLQVRNKSIALSVSIGFTEVLADSFDSMLMVAEQKLLQAKNQGRNRVL